jgi:5-(carboxyamino)imidazole ribonucleotide mutase
VRILGASDPALRTRIKEFQSELADMVMQKDAALRNRLLGQ